MKAIRALLEQITGPGDLGTVLRGAVLVITIRVLASLLAYGVMVTLARSLGAAQYGAYAYALSWLTLVSLPVGFGLNLGAVRFVAEYASGNAMAKVRGYLATASTATAISGAASTIVALLVLWLLSDRVVTVYLGPLAVAMVGITLMGFVALGAQVGRAFGWVGVAYAPSQVLHPLFMLAGIATFHYAATELHASAAVALSLGGFAAGVALQAVIYGWRLWPRLTGIASQLDVRLWVRAAGPILLTQTSAAVMASTDMAMIGYFLTPIDAAHYHAAVKTSVLVMFFHGAAGSLIGPKFAELHAARQRGELQRLLTDIAPWIVIPSMLAFLGLAVLGPLLLRLFGTGFPVAYSAMLLLAAANMVTVLVGPGGLLLIMTGHQDVCAKTLSIAALANVALNAALIPAFGIRGAALATALSTAAQTLVLFWAVLRTLGLQPSIAGTLARRRESTER